VTTRADEIVIEGVRISCSLIPEVYPLYTFPKRHLAARKQTQSSNPAVLIHVTQSLCDSARAGIRRIQNRRVRGLGLFRCSRDTALEGIKRIYFGNQKTANAHTFDHNLIRSSGHDLQLGAFTVQCGKFEEKALEVIEFQRNFLELRAALDY